MAFVSKNVQKLYNWEENCKYQDSAISKHRETILNTELWIYKSTATIEFLKNKVLQRSPFKHLSEMKGQGTGGGKLVTLGEVLSLVTTQSATMVSPGWRNFTFYGL